jgi:hypothetical protein
VPPLAPGNPDARELDLDHIVTHDHMIRPEDRVRLAMGIQ